MTQGSIADGRIVFEEQGREIGPHLAKLSQYAVLCVPPLSFLAPCIMLFKVYVARGSMSNHELSLALDKMSTEIKSVYKCLEQHLVICTSCVLQKYWSAVNWGLNKN